MEGRRLILNHDITIEDGTAGYAGGFLWCHFTGYTLAEAAGIFLDPGNTARIVFQYGEMEDVYEGFTNCTNLATDTDGRVSVCLTKGAD